MEDIKNIDLVQLARQLQRLETLKEDRIVSSSMMYAFHDRNTGTIKIGLMDDPSVGRTRNDKTFTLTETAHRQLNEKTGMNCWNYYDKCRGENPDLLVENINSWLEKQGNDTRRLLRLLQNEDFLTNPEIRAVLSDRYEIIDNPRIFKTAVDAINKACAEHKLHLNVVKASLTDDNMYIKLSSPDLEDVIEPDGKRKVGDIVHGGVVIRNSETGHGRWTAMPYVEVLRCTNGMIGLEQFSRVHLGRKKEIGVIQWSEETVAKNLDALLSEFADVIGQVFNPETFHRMVEDYNRNAGEKIEEPLVAINQVVKKYGLPKSANEDLVEFLMKEQASDTKWGLCMAVTAYAQDGSKVGKYEDQIKLEKAGHEILNTPMKTIIRGF